MLVAGELPVEILLLSTSRVIALDAGEVDMPSKVPQSHNEKKKGKSIQEKRAEKRAKKAGLASPGLRLSSGDDRFGTPGAQARH